MACEDEQVTDGVSSISAEHLSRRRASVAEAWNLTDGFVVIGAGEPLPVPGRYDRTYPFRSHSEYFYLTDRERPGGVLAFDPNEGWFEFLAPVTRDELVWSGTEGAQAGVPDGVYDVSDLPRWLEKRRGRRCGCLGAAVPGLSSDARHEEDLRYALTHVRRVKDDVELARMRTAEEATRSGYLMLDELIAEGQTERQIQISLEAQFFRGGADFLAFDTIVAGGSHSAVLHFTPTTRPLAAGELVLVDAGGEYRGYASDITRTYPVSGAFTSEQAELYAVVRQALAAATQACKPNVEWRDVHRTAAHVVADGLVALRDRDAPGPGFPPLRVDLPLQAGYTMTVEPGIYFIPALLRDDTKRAEYRDAVDWDRVDSLLNFGGIRLEDNVLVTDSGCEVLTSRVPLLDGLSTRTARAPS
jgi:Xaa-Pro aminopeptidase